MKWPIIKNMRPDGGISKRSVLYHRGSNCFVGFLFVYFEFLIFPLYFFNLSNISSLLLFRKSFTICVPHIPLTHAELAAPLS